MKVKKMKKLSLNKNTIANLEIRNMEVVKAGAREFSMDEEATECCGTDYTASCAIPTLAGPGC